MFAYNASKYIEDAIKSVVRQSVGFDNIQLIVIDDCSQDRTKIIIERYAKKYSNNIVVINNECSKGISYSRNRGLKVAEDKYITFLNSDDKFENNVLQT